MPATDPIVQARAEGYRDGIERAAMLLDDESHSAGAQGYSGEPKHADYHATARRIRALAPVQPPAVDLPDSTSAKATDPRGPGLRGGEDATEIERLRAGIRSAIENLGPGDARTILEDTLYGVPASLWRVTYWRDRDAAGPEPSTPPLGSTPPAGATLSPTHLHYPFGDYPGCHICEAQKANDKRAAGQPERSGGEGKP